MSQTGPVEIKGGALIVPMPLGGNQEGGRGMTVKQIKRALKKQGKKLTGKRSTLMKRLRTKGGADGDDDENTNTQPEVEETTTTTQEQKIEGAGMEGGRHTAKHLKQLLKKNGLKTTGTKRALTRRAKKAKLL
jgi:hypothetical protein